MLYQGPFRPSSTATAHGRPQGVPHAQDGPRADTLTRNPAALRPAHLRRAGSMVYHWATLPGARRDLDRLADLPHDPTRVPNVAMLE